MKYDISAGISRSAGRVFTAFRRALFNLLQHQSFESISVQTLCNTADYPRSTFYNYFDDIYDLLDYCLQAPIKSFDREKYIGLPPEERVFAIFSDLYDLLERKREDFDRVLQVNKPNGVLQSSMIKRLQQEVYSSLAEALPAQKNGLPREMLAEHCCGVIYLMLSWCFFRTEQMDRDQAMEGIRRLMGGLFGGERAEAAAP